MATKTDWKIFLGNNTQHDGIARLPDPPTWRSFDAEAMQIEPPTDSEHERRGLSFCARPEMVEMVNAALYLRRPLLITGNPGVGKSSLIYAVAHELKLGRVLRWPITSRVALKDGIYRYDPIGRLHAKQIEGKEPLIGDHLTLGPLGTALLPVKRPRALLIDEIDKSDFDLPNDLLDVFEEGEYRIPELARLRDETADIKDDDGNTVTLKRGLLRCLQFPFVILTSNGEREFPAPFLRRCLQLNLPEPNAAQLTDIVKAHFDGQLSKEAESLIKDFISCQKSATLATDQLLNAVFLIAGRNFGSDQKRTDMIEAVLRSLQIG